MRITDNMKLATVLAGQARSAERTQEASRVASSGMRVEKPSDDATTYASMTRRDGRLGVLQARQDGATRAAGDLELAEGTLSSASDLLVRAKEIALEAANGSVDPQTRANVANEIAGIREQLLGLANTRGSRGYLFGGTKTATAPFDAAGTFVGNDNATQIEIADAVVAPTNTSGAKAFTAAGGRDIFGDLSALQAALSSNNIAGITSSLDNLDASHTQLVNARVDAGLRAERLRSAADVLTSAMTLEKTARASESEADAAQAYSELVNAQGAYERNISVTRQILSLSARWNG